jgi:hypothetical protein
VRSLSCEVLIDLASCDHPPTPDYLLISYGQIKRQHELQISGHMRHSWDCCQTLRTRMTSANEINHLGDTWCMQSLGVMTRSLGPQFVCMSRLPNVRCCMLLLALSTNRAVLVELHLVLWRGLFTCMSIVIRDVRLLSCRSVMQFTRVNILCTEAMTRVCKPSCVFALGNRRFRSWSLLSETCHDSAWYQSRTYQLEEWSFP